MDMSRRAGAEFFGTFWLVLGGCGSAVLAAAFPGLGIGFHGVALAFGLTVLTMAFAVGHISGAHFNPAVSIGLCAGGRFPARELVPYIIAQVLGGIAAAGVLFLIASGKAGFDLAAGSPPTATAPTRRRLLAGGGPRLRDRDDRGLPHDHHGRDRRQGAQGLRPIAIGLALTLIHLISIPVTNTSVNPARSTSQAVFVGDWALGQLWLFWVAPIIGAIVGAVAYKAIAGKSAK